MKWVALAVAAVFLAGCSSINYGSWLDQIGRPGPQTSMTDQEADALGARVRELRLREETIRARLGREPDRVARIAAYRELREIGNERVPLEQQLREAGRSPRPLLGRAPA